jgi:hypothetical protein
LASAAIKAVRSVTGSQPNHRRLREDAAQAFLPGVPLTMNVATGGVNEWDGVTIAGKICGVSKEPGAGLTTVGVTKTASYGAGTIPNQPLATKIMRGAPLNDGRTGVDTSSEDTVFHAQVGPAQVYAITDDGKAYGLTKDTDNHWYVDKTKTLISGAAGASQAVVLVVRGDEFDTRGVSFKFLKVAQQEIV